MLREKLVKNKKSYTLGTFKEKLNDLFGIMQKHLER